MWKCGAQIDDQVIECAPGLQGIDIVQRVHLRQRVEQKLWLNPRLKRLQA